MPTAESWESGVPTPSDADEIATPDHDDMIASDASTSASGTAGTGDDPAVRDEGAERRPITTVDDLRRVGDAPLADHPAIFEQFHARLQAELADIDSA